MSFPGEGGYENPGVFLLSCASRTVPQVLALHPLALVASVLAITLYVRASACDRRFS